MHFSFKRHFAFLSTALGFVISFSGFANTPNPLEEIKQVVRSTKNITAVTAIHIESNRKISYNGNMPFLMASTVKVPIAITLLHRFDEKKDNINRIIHLRANDGVPGSGRLYYLVNKQHVTTSMNTLLRLMLTISDNTASDVLLREVNGPQAVTTRLRELGFTHTVVNRSIRNFYLDTKGVDYKYRAHLFTARDWDKAFNHTPINQKITAWKAMENDTRDTTTSRDMADLLARLYQKQIISAENTDLLLGIMGKCKTGHERIKALLPEHTPVADKTGTWAINSQDLLKNEETKKLFRFASDVGIITLPQNKGHIAIAVYTKSTDYEDHNRDRTIALISQAIYNYFLATTPGIYAEKTQKPKPVISHHIKKKHRV